MPSSLGLEWVRRADSAQLMRISADYVRVSIAHGISHEDAGQELLEFMRCAGTLDSGIVYMRCRVAQVSISFVCSPMGLLSVCSRLLSHGTR